MKIGEAPPAGMVLEAIAQTLELPSFLQQA